ncbi:MAG: hypothetical protein IJC81_04660, partial [Clostridia bacterium]|nr:hypothetical protein [Clostridia bacterium]
MSKVRNRTYILMLIDILIFESIFWCSAFSATTSSTSVTRSFPEYLAASAILLLTLFLARFAFSIYHNVWRYANSRAYLLLVISDIVGGGAGLAMCYFISHIYFGIWQMISIVAFTTLVTLASRFIYQQHYRHLNVTLDTIHKVGIAIVGAGTTGAMLAEELLYTSKSRYKPVCFIDVKKEKIGSRVCGVPVLAEDEGIVERLKTMPVQEIIIALPELDSESTKRLLDLYQK